MGCSSLDLTIEGALADPVIAAAMRADHVDPHRFERLLRSAAREIETARPPRAPGLACMVGTLRDAATGASLRW